MSRISGVPANKAGLFSRMMYGITRKKLGQVPEPLTLLAHHPTLPMGYGMFERAFQGARLVDKRLKSLAEIKAAAMIGCPF